VIAAALATSVVAVSGAEATSASTSRQPLSFTVVPVVVATPDLKFPQPGDVEAAVFNNLQHGHQIGSDRTSCTVVDTHGNLQCTTTVLLPGGTLEVVYTDNVNAKALIAPIAGGTGRYLRTHGYFALRASKQGFLAVLHTT
jgi:hypothetical protein